MAAPAIIALLSSLLGRKSDKPDSYQMSGVDSQRPAQATVGDVTGVQQPAMQQQPQQGNGFQNFANKAQTIGSILSMLKSNQQQPQGGYQMQFRRR